MTVNDAVDVFGDESRFQVLFAAGKPSICIFGEIEILMTNTGLNLCFSFPLDNEFHGRDSLMPLCPLQLRGGDEFISDHPTSDLSLFDFRRLERA